MIISSNIVLNAKLVHSHKKKNMNDTYMGQYTIIWTLWKTAENAVLDHLIENMQNFKMAQQCNL